MNSLKQRSEKRGDLIKTLLFPLLKGSRIKPKKLEKLGSKRRRLPLDRLEQRRLCALPALCNTIELKKHYVTLQWTSSLVNIKTTLQTFNFTSSRQLKGCALFGIGIVFTWLTASCKVEVELKIFVVEEFIMEVASV
jgi:hypothetical protein